MSHDRRSVLAAFGLALPFGLGTGTGAAAHALTRDPLVLRFRSFEESVASAFGPQAVSVSTDSSDETLPCHRIEVGHSELLERGVQGCHNDRPFAGFPAGHLRIVRAGAHPGPVFHGVRLYVHAVDVVWTAGRECRAPGRPLDFALLAPAPIFGGERVMMPAERPAPKPRVG